MAQPFTNEQRDAIRQKLFESALSHALTTGVRKTSLDALTADAGISKSSFYKFFESKEQLFLAVGKQWEDQILSHAGQSLSKTQGMSDKQRAAAFVYSVFEVIHQMGVVRFMREDLPYLSAFLSEEAAREHCLTSAASIFDQLKAAQIHFTAPDETVLSVIQLMYLSILNIRDLGENFFPALRELVQGACDRLVA